MDKLVKFQGSSELSQIITSKSEHLATLKNREPEKIRVNLLALIIEFCSIYKVDEQKSLTDTEINEIANIILLEYFFLKWEDMLLFLKNAKMGKYGKIYGSLDMPTFFQMLETYCEQRTTEAQAINRVKAEDQKREPISEATMKMIAEFKEKQAEKRRKQYIVNEVKEQSEEQKKINEWMQDFKKLTGEVTYKGFAEINGKMMGINEYLEYRNEEESL